MTILRLKRKATVYVKRDLATIHPLAYVMMATILTLGLIIIPMVR
jgi:hypothetical protein